MCRGVLSEFQEACLPSPKLRIRFFILSDIYILFSIDVLVGNTALS